MSAFAEYSPLILLWCAFALWCGGLIKGALGVGTPLLTVPMMAFVLPPQVAIAIMAFPVVIANVWQFIQAPKSTGVIKDFLPAGLAIAVGSAIGTRILVSLDERVLLITVGFFVIVFTLLQGSRHRFQIEQRYLWPAGIGFGLAAGMIGGLSSMFGPMMVLYMVSISNLSKERFVTGISFLYLWAVIPWTGQLFYRDLLDYPVWLYSAVGVIPVVLGMTVGQRIRQHISEAHFNVAIRWVLFVSAGSLILRALR
ncbi:MAG: sulfite exporter TauE/SafE family protein [Burkholderiaceae bacterium]